MPVRIIFLCCELINCLRWVLGKRGSPRPSYCSWWRCPAWSHSWRSSRSPFSSAGCSASSKRDQLCTSGIILTVGNLVNPDLRSELPVLRSCAGPEPQSHTVQITGAKSPDNVHLKRLSMLRKSNIFYQKQKPRPGFKSIITVPILGLAPEHCL